MSWTSWGTIAHDDYKTVQESPWQQVKGCATVCVQIRQLENVDIPAACSTTPPDKASVKDLCELPGAQYKNICGPSDISEPTPGDSDELLNVATGKRMLYTFVAGNSLFTPVCAIPFGFAELFRSVFEWTLHMLSLRGCRIVFVFDGNSDGGDGIKESLPRLDARHVPHRLKLDRCYSVKCSFGNYGSNSALDALSDLRDALQIRCEFICFSTVKHLVMVHSLWILKTCRPKFADLEMDFGAPSDPTEKDAAEALMFAGSFPESYLRRYYCGRAAPKNHKVEQHVEHLVNDNGAGGFWILRKHNWKMSVSFLQAILPKMREAMKLLKLPGLNPRKVYNRFQIIYLIFHSVVDSSLHRTVLFVSLAYAFPSRVLSVLGTQLEDKDWVPPNDVTAWLLTAGEAIVDRLSDTARSLRQVIQSTMVSCDWSLLRHHKPFKARNNIWVYHSEYRAFVWATKCALRGVFAERKDGPRVMVGTRMAEQCCSCQFYKEFDRLWHDLAFDKAGGPRSNVCTGPGCKGERYEAHNMLYCCKNCELGRSCSRHCDITSYHFNEYGTDINSMAVVEASPPLDVHAWNICLPCLPARLTGGEDLTTLDFSRTDAKQLIEATSLGRVFYSDSEWLRQYILSFRPIAESSPQRWLIEESRELLRLSRNHWRTIESFSKVFTSDEHSPKERSEAIDSLCHQIGWGSTQDKRTDTVRQNEAYADNRMIAAINSIHELGVKVPEAFAASRFTRFVFEALSDHPHAWVE